MDSPIQRYLTHIHEEIARIKDGEPASYIPALADVDPDNYGICLATVDGYVYEVGDTREEFTIQSISKPFTYGLALSDRGMAAVDEKIDVEPSGDAYNEISLAEGSGRPSNAMINAGALAATSLVKSAGPYSRSRRILNMFSDFAGRDLAVSERVYKSELAHGHRNKALAYLLRSFNIIESDPDPVVEDYFRQCSVLVNCRDLSIMAATLAFFPIMLNVLLGGLEIPISPATAANLPAEVTVGVRPEAWELVPPGAGIALQVHLVEELGSEGFAHGTARIDGQEVRLSCRLPSRGHVTAGDEAHHSPVAGRGL